MKRRIYVASSWRNEIQPRIVEFLRFAGHTVYDFRNPREDNHGFSWKEIDPEWEEWTFTEFRGALDTEIASDGFALDFEAMKRSDTCVLVLPCGRSAHLEAGWFVGSNRELHIYVPEAYPWEPELMYKMADGLHSLLYTLRDALEK